MRFINNHRFYYKLKGEDSLLDNNNIILSHNIVVCFEENKFKLFSIFEDVYQFHKFQMKIPVNKRTFYEVIFGDRPQKTRFDIDFGNSDIDLTEVMNELISSIILVFKNIGIMLNLNKDFLIYTSHGKEKKSIHVVIDNYYHNNNLEAKEIYNEVIKNIREEFKEFIDSSVYKSVQQFRMFGSQKEGSKRQKIFCTKFKYKNMSIRYNRYSNLNDNIRILRYLERSLVANVIGCVFVPLFIEERKENINNIDDETTNQSLKLFNKKYKYSDSFKYLCKDKNYISLKRLKPSYCDICLRTHQNENPYLIVVDSSVIFNCRRNKKGIFLGSIETKKPEIKINNSFNLLKDLPRIR